MPIVYIGVGSNVGFRESYIQKARIILSHYPGIEFLRSAPIYETAPVGGPPQGKYLNTVWEIKTDLIPRELIKILLDTETSLGRERSVVNAPRTIDLDILFYGDLIVDDKNLAIPHPRISGRWFVLKPLWDLTSDFIHPVLGKSICELLDECHAGH